ncbi:MAG: Diphthamide biosynthesis protein 2 [Alyxoria varia]|nr:MAG: Diphthamide biosynthesis protein 2 [Alyxoria varia]
MAAPILSTPDTRIFENRGSASKVEHTKAPPPSDEQLCIKYEIQWTVEEIRAGKWKRIALQFPDHMLVDSPRVARHLSRRLRNAREHQRAAINETRPNGGSVERDQSSDELNGLSSEYAKLSTGDGNDAELVLDEHVFILGDTSYGACCVDEIAAEHANADCIVHYGRSCLSATSRLPVIYCFTKPTLPVSDVVQAFRSIYSDYSSKIILTAYLPYMYLLEAICDHLKEAGYENIFVAEVEHNTNSPLPNRTIPPEAKLDVTALKQWSLFHVADPPASLLLTLSSRVKDVHIYPTPSLTDPTASQKPIKATSFATLRRRYALITSLSTAPVFGILINTLSVKNYMAVLRHVKQIIAGAGKKSYTVVVGKINAAKIANFSEVEGWVVIGCWESSLFDSKDFWKPIITPFELELALKADADRVWTGAWDSNFDDLLTKPRQAESPNDFETTRENGQYNGSVDNDSRADSQSEASSDDESEPPEFDLRTGRYVSRTRPMATRKPKRTAEQDQDKPAGGQALITRARGDLMRKGAGFSPAAEFFKDKRSWQGLGSDFPIEYDADGSLKPTEGAAVEPGRHGIARGYQNVGVADIT